MAKTYPQTFTKIYMVTKPDFVVKPDTEYVVIIMRVDGEFRTIACPREIFLETKLGDAIMSEDNTTLTNMGLEDADISGFSEGKISPYIYGLITKSDATSTTWNKVVAAITQNASGVRIASIVQMSRILLPKDIVRMIPLNVLPQQGKSLPEYMSPEASIWAAMVGFVTEVGRLLCELFIALANFLAKFLETIAEWGLKLLGALLQVLDIAKYLFAIALCILSWTLCAKFLLYFLITCGILYILKTMGIETIRSSTISIEIHPDHFTISITSSVLNLTATCGITTTDYYGFPIAAIMIQIAISLIIGQLTIQASLQYKEPLLPMFPPEIHITYSMSKETKLSLPAMREWSYRLSHQEGIVEWFKGFAIKIFAPIFIRSYTAELIKMAAMYLSDAQFGFALAAYTATYLYDIGSFLYDIGEARKTLHLRKASEAIYSLLTIGLPAYIYGVLTIFEAVGVSMGPTVTMLLKDFLPLIVCGVYYFFYMHHVMQYDVTATEYAHVILSLVLSLVVSYLAEYMVEMACPSSKKIAKERAGKEYVVEDFLLFIILSNPLLRLAICLMEVTQKIIDWLANLVRKLNDKVRPLVSGGRRMLGKLWKNRKLLLGIISLTMGIACMMMSATEARSVHDYIREKAEFQPPRIDKNTWSWDTNTHELLFRFDMTELGEKTYSSGGVTISSKIMDFGIIIIERGEGDPGTDVDPYGVDPLTGKDYRIPIDFVGLIGEPATVKEEKQWRGEDRENKEWDVFEGEYSIARTNDRNAYIEGTIKFEDWDPGKYYIIIWSVDEWGNARWICYEVDQDPEVRTNRMATANFPGNWDPVWWDATNYYYTISREIIYTEDPRRPNASVFTPYHVVTGPPPTPGFQLTLPPGKTVEIGGTEVAENDTAWGYFTVRIRQLAEMGTITVGEIRIHMYAEPIFFIRCWLYLDLIITPLLYLANIAARKIVGEAAGEKPVQVAAAGEMRLQPSFVWLLMFLWCSVWIINPPRIPYLALLVYLYLGALWGYAYLLIKWFPITRQQVVRRVVGRGLVFSTLIILFCVWRIYALAGFVVFNIPFIFF
ncbi:MAG: hypothetical protein DRI92_02980 [Aquificota bacterium]|nr:MAG: hypothetical protein DRI92_02980 [Aquificota bacterium]